MDHGPGVLPHVRGHLFYVVVTPWVSRMQGEKRGHAGAMVWPMAKKGKRTPPRAKPIKDEVIRMRISAEQKAALTAAAERDGLDLSVWLRQVALRAAGVLSGPIRKQKDFFFASYERFDFPALTEISAFVPVATNPLFPLPKPTQPAAPGSQVGLFSDEIATSESTNIGNVRADLNFSQSHNAAVRFDLLRGENGRGRKVYD